MSFLLLIGSGSLICFMPLALYLLFLSYLNQRSQPTMISGPWDFACLLLGLSGFILIGGPLFLSLLDSNWRGSLFTGKFGWGANALVWSSLAGAYAAALSTIIIFFMVVRKHVTVIYNFDPGSIEQTLFAAIKSSGLSFRRVVGGIEIGGHENDTTAPIEDTETQKPAQIKLAAAPTALKQTATVQIEQFPFLCHGALRWREYDLAVRSEVEAALGITLQEKASPANSVGSWLMAISLGIFFMMLLWVSFLIYQLFIPRH